MVIINGLDTRFDVPPERKIRVIVRSGGPDNLAAGRRSTSIRALVNADLTRAVRQHWTRSPQTEPVANQPATRRGTLPARRFFPARTSSQPLAVQQRYQTTSSHCIRTVFCAISTGKLRFVRRPSCQKKKI